MATSTFTRPPEVPERVQNIDLLKRKEEAMLERMRTKQPDGTIDVEDLPFYPPRQTAVISAADYTRPPLMDDRSANSLYWNIPNRDAVPTTSLAVDSVVADDRAKSAESTVTAGAKSSESAVATGAKSAESTVTAGAKSAQSAVTAGAKSAQSASSSQDPAVHTPSFGDVVGGVVYDLAKFSEVVPPSGDTSFFSKMHWICTRDGRGTTVAFLAFALVVLIGVAVGCIYASTPAAPQAMAQFPQLPQLPQQSGFADQWTVPPSAVPWGDGRLVSPNRQ
jgi:hypothetical protein